MENICLYFFSSYFLYIVLLSECYSYTVNAFFFFFLKASYSFASVQFSSVAQLCPTLCDPMDYSKPGFPVHHQLLVLAQTHVHQLGDAVQPSHPLLFTSPAFSLSQHQGLFQWLSSSHQVTKGIGVSASVLPVNIQDWFPLGWTSFISLQSKGLSRVFSNTTVQKYQFFGTQLSL